MSYIYFPSLNLYMTKNYTLSTICTDCEITINFKSFKYDWGYEIETLYIVFNNIEYSLTADPENNRVTLQERIPYYMLQHCKYVDLSQNISLCEFKYPKKYTFITDMTFRKTKLNGLKYEVFQRMFLESKHPKLCELLYSKTNYFSEQDIFNYLTHNINLWLSERDNTKPLYVMMHGSYDNSTHLIYNYFKKILSSNHRLILESSIGEVNSEIDVIYIDDWILSGGQAFSNLKYKLRECKNLSLITITFILAVCGSKSVNYFHQTFPHNVTKLYTGVIIDDFMTIATNEGFKVEEICEFMDGKYCHKYPVHSEISIPDGIGAFNSYYSNALIKYPRKNF